MSRRRATVSSGIVLSLVVVGGLAWSLLGWQAKANSAPDTLLPAKPVFLYTFDGLESHPQAWQGTGAQKALIESGLAGTVKKLLDFAVLESGEPAAELAEKMVLQAFRRGASLAVGVETVQNLPAPQVTLLLHGCADFEQQLTKLLMAGPLQNLKPKTETIAGRKVIRLPIPETPGNEVGWWTDGGHLVIAFGGNAVQSALDVAQGKLPNLTSNTVVKGLRTAKDFEVASVSLIDLKSLLALVQNLQIPAIPDSGRGAVDVSEVLKSTGLDGLGMLQGRWGFRGEAIWAEAFLQAPQPRTGLLALLDQRAFGVADLPSLPKGCEHFSAFRFDVSKFNTTLTTLIDEGIAKFAPEGTPEVAQHLAMAKTMIGFDPVEDLLDHLGDTIVGFFDPSASALMPAAGLLVQVDDSAKLLATLSKLEALAMQFAGENAKFRTKELNGRSIHIVQFSGPGAFFSPSWTIDKGWLVIGSTPQTVEAHVKRVDGKLASWQAPPEIAAALKAFPQKFVSLSYSDPRPGIRSVMSYASTGISFAELAMVEWRKQREQAGQKVDDSVEFPITAEDVPVAEEVVSPLFPNLSVATVDADGVRWYSRDSLPGLPIPGGGGGGGVESVAVIGVLVALLLPAVQQAREAARRSQSKNNLKQIGLALHNYYDGRNSFPPGTHPNPKLKPEERLSWMISLLPYIEQVSIFDKIDFEKGWKDKANAASLQTAIPIFHNPSQSSVLPVDGYATTHYVGMAGIGKDAPTLPIADKRVGFFGYDRKTTFADVTDGTSNTVIVTDGTKEFGPWAQGGNATLRSLTAKPYINGPDGIGSPHVGGMNALLGDGSVRFISQEIDPTVMEGLITIHGGETLSDF